MKINTNHLYHLSGTGAYQYDLSRNLRHCNILFFFNFPQSMEEITMQDILNGINFNNILYPRWDQKLRKVLLPEKRDLFPGIMYSFVKYVPRTWGPTQSEIISLHIHICSDGIENWAFFVLRCKYQDIIWDFEQKNAVHAALCTNQLSRSEILSPSIPWYYNKEWSLWRQLDEQYDSAKLDNKKWKEIILIGTELNRLVLL